VPRWRKLAFTQLAHYDFACDVHGGKSTRATRLRPSFLTRAPPRGPVSIFRDQINRMPHSDSDAVSCPACHSSESTLYWSQSNERPFSLRQCNNCQLVYTVPRLLGPAMAAYYEERYYGTRNIRFNRLFERLILWFRQRRGRKLARMRPAGRVLDIGCGRGLILAHLQKRGWEAHGVELNEAAARHVQSIPGVRVSVGEFDARNFAEGYFDVVILWHVLEHLADVGSALDGASRILRRGGLLVIAVPNITSWQARLTRFHWFHLDLPRHYAHFSTDWLRRELAARRFRVLEVNHFAFEQNPFGWVQSMLNCCGLRTNLLYDILKSGSARSIERPLRQYPIQSALSLIAFALMLPVVCLLQLLECVFRTGGTIEIYAESE
jgi:2-polyprenyl-3-methyl-5-hydroxy-6-metoxy-1,4-benzoquinol methylase